MRGLRLIAWLAFSVFTADATPVHLSQKASLSHNLKHGKKTRHSKDMPTVKHDKAAGGDYEKGSPLYEKQQQQKSSGGDDEGAYSGYSPASAETMQFVILTTLIIMLVLPLLLLCSSCYRAHTNTPVPSHHFLNVLGEKRTVRLLIIPTLACATTLLMTWLNYRWYAEALGLPLEETYFVSQVINFRRVEPWSAWLARWSIWFLVIFLVVEWKGEVLPWDVMWLPLMWGIALTAVIASGIHQYDIRHTYESPVWGIPGMVRLLIHVIAAFFSFFVCWFETVFFWWPNKIVHALYGTLVIVFIFPIKPEAVTIFLEWVILIVHFVIVWYRAPIVQAQIDMGTWKPWVGCCHCCCPRLEVDTTGTNCCPPTHPQAMGKMSTVGPPVATSPYKH